jgi:hypothetical protein
VLSVSLSTLSDWNNGFDEKMNPLVIPENRGKASKITRNIVKRIVDKAKLMKDQGKTIRIKQFARALLEEDQIVLSSKKVNEILIANDLVDARTRHKRPKFYQSLRQRIPNGLLSVDGSEFVVWIADTFFKFNVELAVDVGTFAHTAFSIADTETTQEVINVLESHIKKWGTPLGVVCDSGSANLSEDAKAYIKKQEIELVPAGPGNPKGNGTNEGAFSQMKKVLGNIRLDISSPRALAKSFIEALISVYINMRNRLCVHGKKSPPEQQMSMEASGDQREFELNRLKKHKKTKALCEKDQLKLDRLHWVIDHFEINVEPEAKKHAERTIKAYDLESIGDTESAFRKAINRKSNRKNLPYFFGILKNIQQKRDDDAKKKYCRERYNYQMMLDMQRRDDEQKEPLTIDHVMSMLEKAVTMKVGFVKEVALRKAREWTQELMKGNKYLGALKKSLSDALGKLNHLSFEEKQKAWELIEQFLSPKTVEKSVTLSL